MFSAKNGAICAKNQRKWTESGRDTSIHKKVKKVKNTKLYLLTSILSPVELDWYRDETVFFENSNGHLPLEHGSTPRNFAKTRFRRFPTFHFSTPKNKSKKFDWKIDLAIFVGFWRCYRETHFAINFYVKLWRRTTNPEVCTTKNHCEYVRTRPRPRLDLDLDQKT